MPSRPYAVATAVGTYVPSFSLYTPGMSTIGVTAARGRLPELIERAHSETVFLERRGKLEAVLVSPERYAQLIEAMEAAEDAEAFDAAMAEEGPNIPWAQVKADLGWE